MKAISLPSYFQTIACIPLSFSQENFDSERSCYACTESFIREHCGPISNAIIDAIPQWYKEKAAEDNLQLNFDVRVHDLKKGEYPATPGWHCDSPVRELYFGQLATGGIPVQDNLVCSISNQPGGVSNTQFLKDGTNIQLTEIPKQDSVLWKKVDSIIRSGPPLPTVETTDGELILFDTQTLHRAMPAIQEGKRVFMRISMTQRDLINNGNLSKFEQVYQII